LRPVRRRFSWTWLGLVPFFLFSIAFLVIPTSYLVIGSFKDLSGNPTLQNYADLTTPEIASSYLTSIEISLVTAVLGGIFGFLLAYAVISGGLPGVLRSGTMTFSGVASNFAGVPLALAFTFTLGRLGFMTLFLQAIGLDI
jgi:putative spermidine/putrescine transport system permease protein